MQLRYLIMRTTGLSCNGTPLELARGISDEFVQNIQ